MWDQIEKRAMVEMARFTIYILPESAKNGLQDEQGFIEIWECELRNFWKSRLEKRAIIIKYIMWNQIEKRAKSLR